jgi:hypothetical protein
VQEIREDVVDVLGDFAPSHQAVKNLSRDFRLVEKKTVFCKVYPQKNFGVSFVTFYFVSVG